MVEGTTIADWARECSSQPWSPGSGDGDAHSYRACGPPDALMKTLEPLLRGDKMAQISSTFLSPSANNQGRQVRNSSPSGVKREKCHANCSTMGPQKPSFGRHAVPLHPRTPFSRALRRDPSSPRFSLVCSPSNAIPALHCVARRGHCASASKYQML